MQKPITSDWQDWINLNVSRGCDKDGIFKILLDEGFGYQQIVDQMGYQPQRDIDTIENPLKAQQDSNEFDDPITIDKSQLFIPNSQKLSTKLAEFYVIEDFLNAQECEQLIKLIRSRLRPSTITNQNGDKNFRTSSTCDLGTFNDKFMQSIDDRICRMIGLDSSYSEVIQGQYYDVGQEFKAHTDYFEAVEYEKFARDHGQRTYTFFIYLNNVEAGGETEFIHLGQKMAPKRGRAVIWNNLTKDGVPNPNTLHHAHPVKVGFKAVITKWFRARGNGPMQTKEINELIPNASLIGFKKTRLDKMLFQEILDYYQINYNAACNERVADDFIYAEGQQTQASTLIGLTTELRGKIHTALQSKLSEWSNRELVPTYVYGIRVYHRGAILKNHRDRNTTHIISAIINVDQQVNTDWPLVIEDNYYRRHDVILKPGEVIFYEGARLLHGRPTPLDGKRFANIFCHFIPATS